MLPTFLLMNLLSLAGDVALQQLVHLEQAVSGELCRRRVLREEQEQKTKDPKEKVNEVSACLGLCPKHFRIYFLTVGHSRFLLGISGFLLLNEEDTLPPCCCSWERLVRTKMEQSVGDHPGRKVLGKHRALS